MALADDLRTQVETIFRSKWTTRDGRVVPDPADVGLGNDGVLFDRATILYADLTSSTGMVDTKTWQFSAEIYKTYLYCAARIIRAEGGEITSYDGDRVMGVFVGDLQSTNAARCALKINWAVINIVNPALKKQYPTADYAVKQVIGIDTSPIRAARTGVRGGNDLVWVGSAANHAAKLTSIKNDGPTWITEAVFDKLHDSSKFGGDPRQLMWKKFNWTARNNEVIYSSSWWWNVDK